MAKGTSIFWPGNFKWNYYGIYLDDWYMIRLCLLIQELTAIQLLKLLYANCHSTSKFEEKRHSNMSSTKLKRQYWHTRQHISWARRCHEKNIRIWLEHVEPEARWCKATCLVAASIWRCNWTWKKAELWNTKMAGKDITHTSAGNNFSCSRQWITVLWITIRFVNLLLWAVF